MTYSLEAENVRGLDFDYEALYRDCVDTVLDYLKCPYEACVNLLLTDDEEILAINRDSRGLAVATDVLSFPMTEYEREGDFDHLSHQSDAFDPDSGELLLGDIVISVDHIHANADAYGHSVKREYAFLIVHSMLHLTGFDHMDEADRTRMEEEQRMIMEILVIGR